MFDLVVAAPLKSSFPFELDRRISRFTDANPGQRDKAQILRQILIRSFPNALNRGAISANTISGFRATGVMSFNPEIPLESQFAIDPIDPVSFTIHRTGAEINETILMFSSGFDFLCGHEFMRPMGMRITILMIDRFGKLLRITR
jgi:hypothetical protein